MNLFCLSDPTLKPAVGKCVLLVELEAAFVSEEAIPSILHDVPDPRGGGDHCGGDLHKMLPTRLHLQWHLCTGVQTVPFCLRVSNSVS